MLTTKQRLSQLATVFRHALMVCPKDNFSVYQRKRLRCFPKQCCDVASLLLAYHLRGQGFLKVERVFGRLGEESHVWLEVDGWIVDITADQFAGGDPVIVTPAKAESWHSQFCVAPPEPAAPLPAVVADYERAYAALKKWLDSSSTRSGTCS
jgi:hypothetical protein